MCLLWSSLLSQLGAALCYWLIESVFRAAALPRRLVLARAHCNRTNENTPHHLPRRDTPSPSPCPSTLVSPAFLFLFPLQPPCICPPAPDCHISYSIFLFTCSLPPLLPLYFALFYPTCPLHHHSVEGVFLRWDVLCSGVTVLQPPTFWMLGVIHTG